MRKNYRYIFLLIAALTIGACDKYNYTDSLQGLGKRVEWLEENAKKLNDQVEALNQIIIAIQSDGFVTSVKSLTDGTYQITFSNGKIVTLRNGKDGKDGKDGEEKAMLINVEKGKDGLYYWVINGKPLLDEDGNPVLAGAIDGKDGKDGKNGIDGTNGKDGKSIGEQSTYVPQMRINPITRNWELSNDGGRTWVDTGVYADGQDGQDDLFTGVRIEEGGKAIVFTLRDGRTFTVPIL